MEASATPASPPLPFTSILQWCEGWPLWQQDALRRIVTAGELTQADIDELVQICRAQHGLPVGEAAAPTPKPLTAAHIPGSAAGAPSVSLKSVSSLQNVGRIPSTQKIEFGPSPGLTVIYGDNGTGKTGYARVLKKACRARGATQEIKPNAFLQPPPTEPAKAKIEARFGGVDTSVDWIDGTESDPRLSNILVFDQFSARAHVGEDNAAIFKPQGLDVLPELAKACHTIRGIISSEAERIRYAIDVTAFKPTTIVGKQITSLSAATSKETIERLAAFTETDNKRLEEIVATLKDDPRLKSAATSAAAQRIRSFADAAKEWATHLSTERLAEYENAIAEANDAAEAARIASRQRLEPSDLRGTFSQAWLKLWEAARDFSTQEAYKDSEFPFTEPNARCVLCQQELSRDAVDRYKRFDAFVRNATQIRADGAKQTLRQMADTLLSLLPLPAPSDVKADLDREAAGLFEKTEPYAKALEARRKHVQDCLRASSWSAIGDLPQSPIDELVTLADRLDARAKSELAAADPDKVKALEAERDELTDKKLLSEKKAEVLQQIKRYELAEKLQACLDDCRTNTITIKAGELETAHVTERFRDAFQAELAKLGLRTLPVTFDEGRPVPGERRHGVRLEGAATRPNGDPLYKVDEIASEGEQRCIALAVFFAELSIASHKSAVVFDDPVSSLDQLRRGKVADRLVEEAKHRQVIVFTHDVVFLAELQRASEKAGVAVQFCNLHWKRDEPGHCEAGLPWDQQGYKERIDSLEKIHRELAAKWSTVANPDDEESMRSAYTKLSAAIERVVQDVLFNGVIKRFDRHIRVGNLKKVAGLTADECTEIIRLYNKTSDVTGRHDDPMERAALVPNPAELLKDIDDLKALIDKVKDRRKARGQSGGHRESQHPYLST